MVDVVGTDPVTVAASAVGSLICGRKKKPGWRDEVAKLPPELRDEATAAVRDTIDQGASPGVNAVRILRVLDKFKRMAAEPPEPPEPPEPEEPDFDNVSGGSSTAADQELSPVFGEPSVPGAAFGAGMIGGKSPKDWARIINESSKARVRYTKGADGTYRRVGKVKPSPATSSQAIKAALASLGLKVAKAKRKTKGVASRVPKGGAGTLAVLGAQYALEALDKHVADRQFRKMEKILKDQQRQTDIIVRRVRVTRAPTTSAAPAPKASAPTRSGPARAIEPARPAPAASTAGAVPQGPPKSLANQGAQRPATPSSTRSKGGQVIWGKGLPGTTPPTWKLPSAAQVVSFIQQLFPDRSRSSAPRSSLPLPSLPPSPSTAVQNFFSPSRLAQPATGEQICYTRKPRSSRRRKRAKPKVCISQAQAKKFGIK